MAAKAISRHKVRIGGTIDSDIADWLMKTQGQEKFSARLNVVLRQAMEAEAEAGGQGLAAFRGTLDNILTRVNALQERVDGIEGRPGGVQPKEKRPRGRPKKASTSAKSRDGGSVAGGTYDVKNDVHWYLSHDRYKKVKPEPLVSAFELVSRKFDSQDRVTVGLLKDEFATTEVGVPYPTFRLFYFPLIRDRMLEKKIIEKVDRPGKKGVYRKRT